MNSELSTLKNAADVVDQFRGRRILVAGDLILDRHTFGTVVRISPEAPVPVVQKRSSRSVPGGAANVAANIASLGGEVYVVGVTGTDAGAAELRAALAARGIGQEYIMADPARITSVKTRIIAEGQHVVRVDEEDSSPIRADLAEELFRRISPLLDSVDAIVISDYAKGLLTAELLRLLIGAAKERGRLVLVDPKQRDYQRYRGASLLTPNRKEVLQAAGLPVHAGEEDVLAAGQKVLAELQIQSLLITQGEAGMTLLERGQPALHIPTVARAVYDVTGAGDTVLATLALALASGAALPCAAWLANVAAGLSVEKVGTATVSSAELRGAAAALFAQPTMPVQEAPQVRNRNPWAAALKQ